MYPNFHSGTSHFTDWTLTRQLTKKVFYNIRRIKSFTYVKKYNCIKGNKEWIREENA